MASESEYLNTRMNLGMFKAQADLKDKFNKQTLEMAEGFVSSNSEKYDKGLLSAAEVMKSEAEANAKQEKEKAAKS